MYYISHLGNYSLIAALGLANLILNCIVIGIGVSLNQALETLVSQTIGQGNLQLCGTYLNRGIFVWSAAFILIALSLTQTEWILLGLGQNPTLAKYT